MTVESARALFFAVTAHGLRPTVFCGSLFPPAVRRPIIDVEMTLKRLAILLAVLIFLAGVGIAWLWQYAYTPQGRARVIIAQLRGDSDTTSRGWLLQHHLVRPGFSYPPEHADHPVRVYVILTTPNYRAIAASDEIVKLGPDVLPIVIESLKDGDHTVRMMAIRACGKFRDPAAIQPLIACQQDAHDPNYINGYDCGQNLCEDSLVEIGPEAVDPLVQRLEDPNETIRYYAAEALGRLKDKRATDALVRHLKDREPSVVWGVTTSLGKIGDPRAIPALMKLLNGPDPNVHDCAADALKDLGVKLRPASQSGKP